MDRALKITVDIMQRAVFKDFQHINVASIPGYKDRISQPMDLATVRNKIDSNSYATPADWLDDMKLVFQNAIDYWEPEGYLHLVFIGQYGLSELDRLSAGLDTRTEEEWLKQVEQVTKKLAADIARKPAGSKTARLAEEMRRKADEVPELSSYDIVNLVNRLNSLHDDAKREVVIEVLKQMEGIETDALDERIDAERLSPLTLRALKAFVDRSDE